MAEQLFLPEMDDKDFFTLATVKGKVIDAIESNLPTGWTWLMRAEEDDRMVIEIRRLAIA